MQERENVLWESHRKKKKKTTGLKKMGIKKQAPSSRGSSRVSTHVHISSLSEQNIR